MKDKKEEMRGKYSKEFRREALERAERDGIPQTAQLLGLAPSYLYSWRKQARQKESSNEAQIRLETENSRLKRENQRLEEELAFLKKCATYFARTPK